MKHTCGNCRTRFESDDDDPRCPNCLRKSTVDVRTPGSNPARPRMIIEGIIGAVMGTLAFYYVLVPRMMGHLVGNSVGLRIYASILGGVLLSVGWLLFPRISPFRKQQQRPRQ